MLSCGNMTGLTLTTNDRSNMSKTKNLIHYCVEVGHSPILNFLERQDPRFRDIESLYEVRVQLLLHFGMVSEKFDGPTERCCCSVLPRPK